MAAKIGVIASGQNTPGAQMDHWYRTRLALGFLIASDGINWGWYFSGLLGQLARTDDDGTILRSFRRLTNRILGGD
jgi:hypothetical protein